MVLSLIPRRFLNPESEKLLVGATPSVRSLVLMSLRGFRKTGATHYSQSSTNSMAGSAMALLFFLPEQQEELLIPCHYKAFPSKAG
jgi:hypothetical protein